MLDKCPECGKEISTSAAFCPGCGYQPVRSDIVREACLLIGVILLSIVGIQYTSAAWVPFGVFVVLLIVRVWRHWQSKTSRDT